MSLDFGLGPAAHGLFGASAPRGIGSHVSVPRGDFPRLLVPRSPARVAAVSLARYTVPSSWRSRALLAGASALARIGAVRLAPGGVELGGPDTFLAHLTHLLGPDDLAVAVHLGPVRANRKPVLHVMDRRGRSVAYAKLGVDDLTCRRVRQEAAALRRVADQATPGLTIPTLIESGVWHELDYLVMKPVSWSAISAVSREARLRAKDSLVAAFPRRHDVLARSPWLLRAVSEIDALPESEDSQRLRIASQRLLARYGGTSMTLGAGHGDWSPWNMGPTHDGVAVWDWERFATDVPVGWDELHYGISASSEGQDSTRADLESLLRVARTVDDADPRPLLGTYLLHRGVSYMVDGQRHSSAREGSLRAWLLPALEAIARERTAA